MPERSLLNSGRFAPGTRWFIVVLSSAMGMTALATDAMLPAFGEIRTQFGYPPDSTVVTGLVTAFMAGLGLGQLPAGLLADRFGRRPVLWGGIAVYVTGAVAAILAPSLPLMIGARFVWGLGAAGPRVAALAMVRDAYQGEQMARQMSSIMAVFLIIPMVAPTIGAGVLVVGNWQAVFGVMIAVALVVLLLSFGLPATMAAGARRQLSGREIWASWRIVLSTPGSVGYLIALTALTSVFFAYLGSSEAIFGEMYDLESAYPFIFSGLSLCLAVAIVLNGRFVESVGLATIIRIGPIVLTATSGFMLVTSLIAGGVPAFWVLMVGLAATLMLVQVLLTNLNSAAMIPLGHVAGSGSALFGMIPMVTGSAIASVINARLGDTVVPFASAFVVAGLAASVGVWLALRSAPIVRGASS